MNICSKFGLEIYKKKADVVDYIIYRKLNPYPNILKKNKFFCFLVLIGRPIDHTSSVYLDETLYTE